MATVTVGVAELRKAARWARPDPKAPLPVLHHVRVSVAGGQLVLAVYDWETLLLARCYGDGPADPGTGSVLIPDGQLAEAVASLPKTGLAEVTVKEPMLDLVTGAGTANAHRLSIAQDVDPAKYPALPGMPPIAGWADGTVFGPAAAQVAGCCSDEDQLPLIQAVLFAPDGGVLGMEGTNRYIIGMRQIPFTRPACPSGPPTALIPAPLVSRFVKAGLDGGPVFLGSGDETVMLSDGWHTVVTKPPAGDYPKVRTIAARIPEATAEIEADTCDLHAACKAAGETLDAAADAEIKKLLDDTSDKRPDVDKRRAVNARRGQGMFLEVVPGGGGPHTAELFTVNLFTAAESGRWPLSGAVADGTPSVCSLNPALLARLLPSEGKVTVHLTGGYKPVKVTVAGSPYTGVICPIKSDPPAKG